jgi:hypothetical protein
VSSVALHLARAGSACVLVAGLSQPHLAAAQPTTEELQREIQQRDAQIQQLLRRMDALEREVKAQKAATPRPAPPPRPAPAPPAEAQAAPTAPPPVAMTPTPTPPTLAPPSIGPTPVKPLMPSATPAPTPTTEAEAEEAMISRALENTLINQGGQLLPPFVYQLVPDFGYTHQSLDQLAFVSNGAIVRQQSHKDLLEWGFGFRIGLPWETQIGIRIPVGLDYGSATFGGTTTANSTRGGLGDISLTLQKQVFHEKGWLPDVLLNFIYRANTGSTSLSQTQISTFPFAVGTGSGFNAISGGVTALKRQDPLVFLGGFEYTHSFPSTIAGVQQTVGDVYSLRTEAILAASPDTSLRLGWLVNWQQRSTIAGTSVPGSNQNFSFLELGVGSIITPKIYLDASLLVGLTRDSPDFTALLSLPFRF